MRITYTKLANQLQFKYVIFGQRQSFTLDKFDEDSNAVVIAGFVARRRAFGGESVDADCTHPFSWLQRIILSTKRHIFVIHLNQEQIIQ